jgi:hypothetical protein
MWFHLAERSLGCFIADTTSLFTARPSWVLFAHGQRVEQQGNDCSRRHSAAYNGANLQEC